MINIIRNIHHASFSVASQLIKQVLSKKRTSELIGASSPSPHELLITMLRTALMGVMDLNTLQNIHSLSKVLMYATYTNSSIEWSSVDKKNVFVSASSNPHYSIQYRMMFLYLFILARVGREWRIRDAAAAGTPRSTEQREDDCLSSEESETEFLERDFLDD